MKGMRSKMKLYLSMIIFLILTGSIFFFHLKPNGISGLAIFQTLTQSEFNEGTHTNTTAENNDLIMSGVVKNRTGSYISNTTEVGSTITSIKATWNATGLNWTQTTQADFDAGIKTNIDTKTLNDSVLLKAEFENDTNTMLLMHLNNNSAIGDNSTYAIDEALRNNGTFEGNAKWNCTISKFGGCSVELGGAPNYVSIPDSATLSTATANFTAELWMKSGVGVTAGTVIGLWNYSGSAYAWIIYLSGDNILLYASNDGTNANVTACSKNVVDQNWHHLAYVYNGTNVTFYVDGSYICGFGHSGGFYDSNSDIMIGAYWNNVPVENFVGYVDEVRISNTTRYTANFTPNPYAILGNISSQVLDTKYNGTMATKAYTNVTVHPGVNITLLVGYSNDNINWNYTPAKTFTANGTYAYDFIDINWILANATAFYSRRDSAATVFNDRMWVTGGYGASFFENEVLYSDDGFIWTNAPNAAWDGRRHHAALTYDNMMWVMGGKNTSNVYTNEVWNSSDGESWTQVTTAANWSRRAWFGATVHNNLMFVAGGFNGTRLRDVWSSPDGINWTSVTASANWSGRYGHSLLSYNNKLWLLGGLNLTGYQNEVWYSEDNGVTWTLAIASAPWKGAYLHSSVVYDNKMWVISGAGTGPIYYNETWHSSDGINWVRAQDWRIRFAHNSLVYKDKIWSMGGDYIASPGVHQSDVWYGDVYLWTGRYIKWNATLQTNDIAITPELHSVDLEYVPISVELSTDGTTWLTVANNTAYTSGFGSGTQLRYRVNMSTHDATLTPYLHDITLNYTVLDITAPTVTLISPTNNTGNNDGNLTFYYNVTDDSNIANCSLIFNGIINQTNTSITRNATQNFTLSLEPGSYNWSVNCTDTFGNTGSSEGRLFSVIFLTKFSGSTTNLSNVNISNIVNFVIENATAGKINFSENVNLSFVANIDNYVNLSFNRIEINSTALPALNKSARLYLYNLTFTNPRILKEGSVCSDCTKISYSGGNLIFDVSSFSVYSAEETPSAPPEGGGVSGGVSGVSAPTTVTLDNVTVSPTKIEQKLKQGENATEVISLTNNLAKEANLNFSVEGKVKELIFLSRTSMKIAALKSDTLEVKIYIPENADAGVYTGDLIIKGIGFEKIVSVLIIVPEKVEKLVDVKVEIIKKLIEPGEPLQFQISVYNLGTERRYDIELNYLIKDGSDAIKLTKKETVAIETSLGVARTIPLEIGEGKYKLDVIVKYDSQTATAGDVFEVKSPFLTEQFIRQIKIVFIVLVGIILIATAWELKKIRAKIKGFKRKKRKKVHKP